MKVRSFLFCATRGPCAHNKQFAYIFIVNQISPDSSRYTSVLFLFCVSTTIPNVERMQSNARDFCTSSDRQSQGQADINKVSFSSLAVRFPLYQLTQNVIARESAGKHINRVQLQTCIVQYFKKYLYEQQGEAFRFSKAFPKPALCRWGHFCNLLTEH